MSVGGTSSRAGACGRTSGRRFLRGSRLVLGLRLGEADRNDPRDVHDATRGAQEHVGCSGGSLARVFTRYLCWTLFHEEYATSIRLDPPQAG